MSRRSLAVIPAIVCAIGLLVMSSPFVHAGPPGKLPLAERFVVADFDVTLQPGVWHGFTIQPSSARGGYIIESNPLETIFGFHDLKYVVQPEFNGFEWNDVLRAQTRPEFEPMPVNFRVYSTEKLTVATEFTTLLMPGVWTGFQLGPSSQDRGFVPEITPLRPSQDGAHIQRTLVQPEFNGFEWNDVLRVQIPGSMPPLPVRVRVYDTERLPLIREFQATLLPGVWHGYRLAPCMMDGGFVVEVTPLQSASDGAFVQTIRVQQEHDGIAWYDVLRMQIPTTQATMPVSVRVYGLVVP